MKTIGTYAVRATAVAVALAATLASAQAATISKGTRVLCVLGQNVDSRTATVGTNFTLVVDDPAQRTSPARRFTGALPTLPDPAV